MLELQGRPFQFGILITAAALVCACAPPRTAEQQRGDSLARAGAHKMGQRSDATALGSLVGGAQAFARRAYGADATSLVEVQGARERAACGVVAGHRFIYREQGAPIVEGEIPSTSFDAIATNWCPPGWPMPANY